MSVPSTPSTPSSPPVEPYEIRTITSKDENDILAFLRRFFFRDEPLNLEVKLLEKEDSTCPELEAYSLKSIKDGLSLMAVTASGKIIGLTLNGITERNEVEEEKECPNPKFKKIMKLLSTVDKQADIFGQYPDVDQVLLVKILSVDDAWRGKGVGRELMERTRDLAREQGYSLMRVDCTSDFSAKATARLGFDCVYSLKYEDYKVNGKTVFKPALPHTKVQVFTQRIS